MLNLFPIAKHALAIGKLDNNYKYNKDSELRNKEFNRTQYK